MAASVIYELPDGDSRELLVPAGTSLMQAAISGGVPGIVAECGGQLMCATCHVYVEDSDGALPDMSQDERDMLELAAARTTSQSRLSCQLVCAASTAAVRVRIPERQV
jgi:2Fe-2S ferredoxin